MKANRKEEMKRVRTAYEERFGTYGNIELEDEFLSKELAEKYENWNEEEYCFNTDSNEAFIELLDEEDFGKLIEKYEEEIERA